MILCQEVNRTVDVCFPSMWQQIESLFDFGLVDLRLPALPVLRTYQKILFYLFDDFSSFMTLFLIFQDAKRKEEFFHHVEG